MKVIYDTDGKAGERVYFDDDNTGKRHYFPFYKIKLFDGWRQTELNCWPDAKSQKEYFEKHPEKDATPK